MIKVRDERRPLVGADNKLSIQVSSTTAHKNICVKLC